MALEVGERVGDYTIVALIGAGGMGRVYKVRNIISNREEAMKVLLPDLDSEHELAERFIVEIRTLAGLEHPNIAQLRTAFQFQNQLIMIMEFVEGATLEKLASESALPVERVLDYATQTLSALSFAHSHGVIHRDVKPANVMITTHGQVKLMDFGIAKNADEMHLTRPGTTIGSVYYMSPEQVRGGTVDARSDLYSFGVTLYESLTGRKPFRANTSFSVLNAHLNEAPVPPIEVNPGLSPELNSIVLHALAKNPDDRFQTAQEFHDALKALRKPMASPVAAKPAPRPPTFIPAASVEPASPRAAKSHRGLWIGMGALGAILALVAVAWVLPHLYSTLAKQKAASQNASAASPVPSQGGSTQQGAPTPDLAQQVNPAGNTSASGSPNPSGATSPTEGQLKAGNPDRQGRFETEAHGNGSDSQHRPSYSEPTTPGGDQGSSGASGSGGTVAPAAPTTVSAPAGPSPLEVREVHDRLMNIAARADAARAGVQSIRSQQQAQGLDIRGDILGAMSRMNNDLREAQAALKQNDLETVKQYLERADNETAKLESFLGR
jgi:serine/threonine-protein kinase